MAGDNPPKQPSANPERQKQASRITAISQQISEPLRGLQNQVTALVNEVKSNNEATQTREQEYQDGYLRWVKRSTVGSIVVSALSLILSAGVLIVLYNQLHAQRIDQRAWIKIETAFEPILENQPLQVELTITNSGKTPAKRIAQSYSIQKVASGTPPAWATPGVEAFAGLLVPTGRISTKVQRQKDKANLFDPLTMTKTDIDEIKSGKAYIAILAKIEYFDIYDIPHWIKFCFWKSFTPGNYAARECVEYNDVDNN